MNHKLMFTFLIIFLFGSLSLSATSERLIALETERLKIETQKTLIYSQINVVKNTIESLSDGLAERKSKLSQRLQSAHLIKNYTWGAFIEVQNLNLLKRNLNTLKSINQYDLNFIREQAYKLDELKREKQKLSLANKKFEQLTKQLEKQEELILKEEDDENEKLVKTSTPSLLLLKGQLSRPIETTIIEPYGLVKTQKVSNTIPQYLMYNKGILFSYDPEAHVQSVGPGKVIFRDVLNHWGESIILEHDGGYYSVYANVKNCLVELQQKVQMSEKICDAISKNFYFELRHLKVNINPKNWIKDL